VKKLYVSLFFLFGLCEGCLETSLTQDSYGSKKNVQEIEEYKRQIEIGRNMAGRLLQFYGMYHDDALIRYVNEVGLYLAEFTETKEQKYMFAILDTEIVNAFACPGGYILITLGSLRNMNNESELAMVLSHEMIHVEKKHAYNALIKLDKTKLSQTEDLDPLLRIRQRNPGSYSNKVGENIAEYLSGAVGPGIALVHTARAGLTIIMEKGLDKSQELEADELGIKLAVRANYDPYALNNFLRRLQKQKSHINTEVLLSTHPSLHERTLAIDTLLRNIHAQEMRAAKGEARFLRYTKKIKQTEVL
jgi:predicted Zn-dependent protease